MFKTKIIILFIFLILIIGISNVKASNEMVLLNKIIYIDAGHGGIDPGAIYKDIRESDINLVFAKRVGEMLEKKGAIIYYIRDGDYDLSITKINRKKSDLSNRVRLINDSNASLYLSFHVNSENSSTWHGTQIFYSNILKKNKKIALIYQQKLEENNISKRNISVIKNTYMYDRINIPGILIEIGFISNYSDREKMQSNKYIEEFSKIITFATEKVFQ